MIPGRADTTMPPMLEHRGHYQNRSQQIGAPSVAHKADTNESDWTIARLIASSVETAKAGRPAKNLTPGSENAKLSIIGASKAMGRSACLAVVTELGSLGTFGRIALGRSNSYPGVRN